MPRGISTGVLLPQLYTPSCSYYTQALAQLEKPTVCYGSVVRRRYSRTGWIGYDLSVRDWSPLLRRTETVTPCQELGRKRAQTIFGHALDVIFLKRTCGLSMPCDRYKKTFLLSKTPHMKIGQRVAFHVVEEVLGKHRRWRAVGIRTAQ